MLECNNTVHTLGLFGNQIGNRVTIREYVESEQDHPQFWYLSSNIISDTGAQKLEEMLAVNPTVRSIDLHGNYISALRLRAIKTLLNDSERQRARKENYRKLEQDRKLEQCREVYAMYYSFHNSAKENERNRYHSGHESRTADTFQ